MASCREHHLGRAGIAWEDAAISEVGRLADGAALKAPVLEAVPLAAGEFVYGELYATGWRFFGLDTVLYERRTMLAGGGLLILACAIGNRRRRMEAEAHAAPQWRPLGPLRMVVTPVRLLVWHRQAWWSVWLAGVTDVRCYPEHQTLDLFFEADAPYRLVGPDVPTLGVAVSETLRKNRCRRVAREECAKGNPPSPSQQSGGIAP